MLITASNYIINYTRFEILPYACNFLSIGCDFTMWGMNGDRNRISPR